MHEFQANDYRKRVLAAVQARGGVGGSDPFELYDLPLETAEQLGDDAVATRINAVWAFWQKSRDHPKYRGLVLALLAAHEEMAAELISSQARARLAERVRRDRANRDGQRFAELDAAVARLVQRFGGIPEGKLAGLRALAAARGIDPDTFALRIRRYKIRPDGSPARPQGPPVGADVLRQVRADLDELGRLVGETPPASLFDLLGVSPDADRSEIRAARDAHAARNRERRPDRQRALVDDLLAAVTALLLDRDPDAYLDALVPEVTEQLRPAVAAAVLVEDTLTPADYGTFLADAERWGLDGRRARAVLAELAREHNVGVPAVTQAPPSRAAGRSSPFPPVPFPPVPSPSVPSPSVPSRAAAWLEPLAKARAALRAGHPVQAHGLVAEAHECAGELLPAIRAVADEIERVISTAGEVWRRAEAALSGRRLRTAATLLEELARDAVDVPGPGGRVVTDELTTVRARLTRADELVAAADRTHGTEREKALLAALEIVADHQDALEVLSAAGVAPPERVQAWRSDGGVAVTWQPSPSAGPLRYRVLRIDPDGDSRAVGVTQVTSIEDGGVGPDAPMPTYEVTAGRGDVWSAPARWTPVPAQTPVPARPAPPPPGRTAADTLAPAAALHLVGDRLRWTWPPGCTEMLVVWRQDAPVSDADDPAAQRRKVTNTRYELDGGVTVPADRPLHLAVFGCVRESGRLVIAGTCAPSARLTAALA